MQEGEKNDGTEGMSVEEMFLGVQGSYQEAQLCAQEENKAFARTELLRMGKLRTYCLRILPITSNPDGSPTYPSYEYPVHQLLLELEKPATGNKPQKTYVTATRATDAEYSIDPIGTYRRTVVGAAEEDGDDKLAGKITGSSFGGGLKYSYGHCLYVFDLGGRAKGVQMMTLSHAQFRDLDEGRFKLWNKKLAENSSYSCPISLVYDAYLMEVGKRKNGVKTEYVISIDSEPEPVPLTREKLTVLMGAPRIPEIIYRYTRYHLRATIGFLGQCDGTYGMLLMETDETKMVADILDGELPKEDMSAFSFDHRAKDNRENRRGGGGISLDNLFERHDELQRQELSGKIEEGQKLRAMVRSYIEQEGLSVRVTRSTSNRKLFDLVGSEMEGPKSSDEPENVPGEEEEQPEETEERAGRPRHRR